MRACLRLMLAYCRLDTLAMVKVLEGLKELVKQVFAVIKNSLEFWLELLVFLRSKDEKSAYFKWCWIIS